MIPRILNSRSRDEQGSVMIAVIVVGIVAMLVLTTVDSVTGGLNLTRNDQNRSNAFQFANAGVDKAVYRLDRNIMPTTADPLSLSYVPTVVDGKVVAFSETLEVGVSSYTITVTQDPPGQPTKWKVHSVGTDRPTGRQRVAIATVSARPLFENGFFTILDFYLTGQQDSPVAYDSAVCPAALNCEITPVPGGLGTNAKIIGADMTIKSFVDDWEAFNMYGRATQEAAEGDCGLISANSDPSQARCAEFGGAVNALTDRLEYPLPPAPAGTQTCINGGNFFTADGTTTVIPAGDYTCEDVILRGTVNVSPVTRPDGTVITGVRLWPTKTFTLANHSIVNKSQPTKKFQVFYPEQTEDTASSICGGEIWGLLYTPGLDVTCNGSAQPRIYGAVVAEQHAGTGSHFDFHWDIDAINAVNDGKYVVKNWRECPSNTPVTADC